MTSLRPPPEVDMHSLLFKAHTRIIKAEQQFFNSHVVDMGKGADLLSEAKSYLADAMEYLRKFDMTEKEDGGIVDAPEPERRVINDLHITHMNAY